MDELRAYMRSVRRLLEPIEYKQKREYTIDGDSGTETTRVLEVSSCDHCKKEYSEPSFWWTVSWRGAQEEVPEKVGIKFGLPEGATFADALVKVMFKSALEGNTHAVREIRESIEGKIVQSTLSVPTAALLRAFFSDASAGTAPQGAS